jgi:hypothetical protein
LPPDKFFPPAGRKNAFASEKLKRAVILSSNPLQLLSGRYREQKNKAAEKKIRR